MKRKNIWVLLLCVLVLCPGCRQGNDAPETTGGTDTVGGESPAESRAETGAAVDPAARDDLEESYDWEGMTFGLYGRDRIMFHGAITAEEEKGEQLNDAIYERTRAVEDRFHLVFEETLAVTTDTDPAINAAKAGDKSYRVIHARNVHAVQYAAQQLVHNWADIDTIDLEKNYWYGSINENLSFGGEMYCAAGAYNLSSFDFTHILMFNKQMMADLRLESPYEKVRRGEWTYDTFYEYGTAARNDVNSDGVMDLADTYGYAASAKQIPSSFWEAAGQLGIVRDADGLRLVIGTDEPFLDVLMKIYDMAWDGGFWYPEMNTQTIPPSSLQLFTQNQALMMDSTFYDVKQFRDMDTDFGMIPYPKYTAEQEHYLSRIEGCELPVIPLVLTEKEADEAGAVLEALASYSLHHTVPVYYEVYLKTRLSRDSESADMLDLIFSHRVFDLSDTVWCNELRDGVIFSCFKSNNRNIVSAMKKVGPVVEKSIAETVEGYRSGT